MARWSRSQRAAGWPGQPPQLHDLSARHSHIAMEGWPAGPVDDATVLDQEVVAHVPRSPEPVARAARAPSPLRDGPRLPAPSGPDRQRGEWYPKEGGNG